MGILVGVAYGTGLSVLLLFGCHRWWLTLRWRCSTPRAVPRGDPLWRPRVTVQLPLYNEAPVVRRAIDAIGGLDYPDSLLEVQILDDSQDHTTALAREAATRWRERGRHMRVLHRVDRVGFKAGALAAGLRQAKGEVIAVFDADFVPQPDFLRLALVRMEEGVGVVQARWGHLNEEQSWLTRIQAIILDGHFAIEQCVRSRTGRWFNFNGTAGIWKRRCIEEAGGWHHDTLTEDLDLSYRAQLAGWRFVFAEELTVPAELPATMQDFRVQQHRWAKGSIQTARKLLPMILRGRVPWKVRLEAAIHLTANLAYPMVLGVALVAPLLTVPGIQPSLSLGAEVHLAVFGMGTLGLFAFYGQAIAATHPDWPRRLSRLPGLLLVGISLSLSQTRAVWEALSGSTSSFVRTPKRGEDGVARARPSLAAVPLGEAALCAWQLVGLYLAARAGAWALLPVQALLCVGFLVAAHDAWPPTRSGDRNASAALSSGAQEV